MLERSGVALVHAGVAVCGWEALTALRDEIGLRSPLHTVEKLIDHLGATRFVGHTHSSYSERILGALELLGAQAAVTVRGNAGLGRRARRPAAGRRGGWGARPASDARKPAARRWRPRPRSASDARDRHRRRARRRGDGGGPVGRCARVRSRAVPHRS